MSRQIHLPDRRSIEWSRSSKIKVVVKGEASVHPKKGHPRSLGLLLLDIHRPFSRMATFQDPRLKLPAHSQAVLAEFESILASNLSWLTDHLDQVQHEWNRG
jgi:hypothetical protein